MATATPRVLALATQGPGSGDRARLAYLLEPLEPRFLDVERARRGTLPRRLLAEVARSRPDVVVLEGTGVSGGAAVLLARALRGTPFVVSTGDAVGPFLRAFHPSVAPVAGLYERALYRGAAGVIAWTPYLAGRALSLGARRAMTAAHFATGTPRPEARAEVRARLGIPDDALVFGIAGSLLRDPKHGYSYGVELIRALRRTRRPDIRALVIGDGDGLAALRELAGEELGRRVLLPGAVPAEEVLDHLAAMDVGLLSQTTDLVGAMRYTTKLPEYLRAGLPVIAPQTPLAYDLDGGWLWRLPGDAPWDEEHVAALASLIETVTPGEVGARAALVPADLALFDAESQQRRVCAFVAEVVGQPR